MSGDEWVPVPFIVPRAGHWGVAVRSTEIGRLAVDVSHPNGSTVTLDLCSVEQSRGHVLRAFARPGVLRVQVGAHLVECQNPNIRPEHFLPAARPRRHYHTDEGHARRVEVTGCIDCPFMVARSIPGEGGIWSAFVQQHECRFIPGVTIPRDIVGTLSGCPMLQGDPVTVTLGRST